MDFPPFPAFPWSLQTLKVFQAGNNSVVSLAHDDANIVLRL
jgi:hypothetical protein